MRKLTKELINQCLTKAKMNTTQGEQSAILLAAATIAASILTFTNKVDKHCGSDKHKK